MDTQDRKTRNYYVKPLVTAAIAGAVATYWWRDARYVYLMGTDTKIPTALLAAGCGFVGSELASLVSDTVFPHVENPCIFTAPAHTAVAIGAQAGTVAVLENIVAPGSSGEDGVVYLVGLAALCEIGSTYIADKWIMPMLSAGADM